LKEATVHDWSSRKNAGTISAVHGDCGFFKGDASYLFLAIYFALMGYQYVASKHAIEIAAATNCRQSNGSDNYGSGPPFSFRTLRLRGLA
jgi:hypothetical protein